MEHGVRDRILLKALELFYKQGIHNTGINQIIKESKVAKASFYDYFPSKDDLIFECLDSYNTFQIDQMKTLIGKSKNFYDFIGNWVRKIKQKIAENSLYYGCPIANVRFGFISEIDVAYIRKFNDIITDWANLLNEYLIEQQQRGQIPRKLKTVQLAKRMIQIYEGAVIMWKLTDDTSYFDDLEKIARELI